ncbi:ATP-binding protein, partial [uncultured Eudoraea sp.]|uniref:ATP-binding protein n=1 Tax=uncultured Eudoraea sp. TaxID=1035614 RepID=UPI002612BC4F
MKTLVAFANTAGGILVIGRDDNGTIIGLGDVLQAEESIANAIADSIMPVMMPDIEIITFETKELLVVKVAHWSGPFYLKSEGPEDGVYIRLGSTNRKAGPEILTELHRTIRRVSFDQEPCNELSEDDLDMDKAESAFKSVNRSIDKHKLESLGLIVPYAGRKTVSNGCLILFGREKHRNRFFPDARVSCARFRGTDKSQFIDRLDIEGSLLDAVKDVPKFIRLNTRLLSRIESFKREDIPAYPELAVREVLINALVHSDYSLTGMRILVSIYSDRMEIQNPGMLPFGITLEDFKAGVSKIRNRVIARIFRELGLMEEWGSG